MHPPQRLFAWHRSLTATQQLKQISFFAKKYCRERLRFCEPPQSHRNTSPVLPPDFALSLQATKAQAHQA